MKYSSGHFYSVIPSKEDVELGESVSQGHKGIDMGEDKQLELLEDMIPYCKTFEKIEFKKFRKDNAYYYGSDAVFLYSMLRKFLPKKLVEVGVGYSSQLIREVMGLMDFEIASIDPDKKVFALSGGYKINKKVQDVDMSVFEKLDEGDFLFIDSSHVAKTGSDVCHIVFNILPILKSGVIIHFHDVFYPLDYPKRWIENGRYWNEIYVLRAFLQYNSQFRVLLFNDFMQQKHKDWFEENLPFCLQSSARLFGKAGSIWLQKY